jgi:hypothetical protein
MVTGTHRQPTSIKLKELFLSLQNQLQAKMVTNREFVHHAPTKGAASEQAWLAMFNAYLPQRYRADSAFVIDCDGELSDQIDIVIYDRQYSPLLFHQDGVLYVPAESVYAVFDVKQELGRWMILQAARKAASVRKLKRTSVPIPYAAGTYRPPQRNHRWDLVPANLVGNRRIRRTTRQGPDPAPTQPIPQPGMRRPPRRLRSHPQKQENQN